jgi:ABC-type sugar transport system permease subunit
LIAVLSITIQLPISLVLALLVARHLPGRSIFRTIFFLPYVLSDVTTGVIWSFVYKPENGLLNNAISSLKLGQPQAWLGNTDMVLVAVFVVMCWKYFGFHLILYVAGLQQIPADLEEAARIDGANDFQVLWRIIIPLSKPILLTIGMFYGVTHWNEFFLPLLYFNDKAMMPLPVILRDILSSAGMSEYVESNAVSAASQESLKMAAVVLTTIPMLVVYPWIQRYFTKGILLGGIKE